MGEVFRGRNPGWISHVCHGSLVFGKKSGVAKSPVLACPGQEDRINGDRINGLVISPTYKWGIPWGYNPLIRSPLILTSNGTSKLRLVVQLMILRRLLAPSKRWLALGFLNHQQHESCILRCLGLSTRYDARQSQVMSMLTQQSTSLLYKVGPYQL